jgi:arylformamidase
MPIDYEAEYNNRARVPDSPQIMARWTGLAASYRAEAAAAGRAELGVRYGASQRQMIDLYFPVRRANAPLAIFIHGGYWRALAPAAFSHLANGLNARGMTFGVVGYDLCPAVGIADIVDQIRAACLHLFRRFKQPILATGHSAGGHLTACMLATDWAALAPDAPEDLVAAGYAISGVFDLEPLRHTAMNADFRLDEAEARRLSPLCWEVPAGRSLDAVVGGDESGEFIRQSHTLAEAWNQDEVVCRCEVVPGKNHFTIIEALADPDSAMVERIVALAQNQ